MKKKILLAALMAASTQSAFAAVFGHPGARGPMVLPPSAVPGARVPLPTNKEAITFLKNAFSEGLWSAAIPSWAGNKRRENDYALPSVNYLPERRQPGALPDHAHFGAESFHINIYYDSDRQFNWFGLTSGVGKFAMFWLRDVPGERLTKFRPSWDGDGIVIESRRTEAEVRYYGPRGTDRQRLTLKLSPEGKAVGMMIENWNKWTPFFKTKRAAVWSEKTVPLPWVEYPEKKRNTP